MAFPVLAPVRLKPAEQALLYAILHGWKTLRAGCEASALCR